MNTVGGYDYHKTLNDRIDQAETKGSLRLIEARIAWHYDNGFIDQTQFRKLDNKIFVKLNKLD